MNKNKFITFLFLLNLLTACGGGSSGTGISSSYTNLSGIIVSPEGKALASTKVKVLNTDEVTTTDEAGSFELRTNVSSGEAILQISSTEGAQAEVVIPEINNTNQTLDLSILFDTKANYARLLELTIRARIVRNCSTFFLNARTIKQISPIIEGLECSVEVIFKSDGLPKDNVVFELQHRACGADEPWKTSAIGKTGTSGPGTGEVNFNFKNDIQHCVYRVTGPLESTDSPLNIQINTLRKEAFDRE